jgi:hypothetical protein
MKKARTQLSRRNFLFAATAGTAAGAAAIVARNGAVPEPAPDKDAESKKGYQLTDHVRNYYRTAKI